MISRAPLYVFDSFALLAFFRAESGGPRVRALLTDPATSITIASVNCGEVAYRTEREFGFERLREILGKIIEYQIDVVDVDRSLALVAARHRAIYKMSYADCIATALAQRLDATLVTGDPDFQQVEHLVNVEWLPQDA